MLTAHHLIGTWKNNVDLYIALSEFSRQKYIEGGLPKDRIFVKPNFVDPDPGQKLALGDYVLFVGRLSEEKGLRVLLDAWSQLRHSIPLRIAGEGPLISEIAKSVDAIDPSGRTFMGPLSPQDVIRAMQGARFLVFPSVWFETFGLSMVEAFACRLPVIASRLGSMAEIVTDGLTGLHFSAGDPVDLAAKVDWAWTHPQEMEEMGGNARKEYETKYTADRNYEHILGLWHHLGIGSPS